MKIAVDFDGTCVLHDYPNIGRDIGAKPHLAKLVEDGHQLILYTMRSGKHLADAVRWFEDEGLPLYGVNHNPDQDAWTESPKAYAQLYIDDAAYGAPLVREYEGERPHFDWSRFNLNNSYQCPKETKAIQSICQNQQP